MGRRASEGSAAAMLRKKSFGTFTIKPENTLNDEPLSQLQSDEAVIESDSDSGELPAKRRSSCEPESSKRFRKKFSSCEACRKLKTKCVLVPGLKLCSRCQRLMISCSLKDTMRDVDVEPVNTPEGLEARVSSIEETMRLVTGKLDSILDRLTPQQQPSGNGTSTLGSMKYSNTQVNTAPLNVIKGIDSQLFNRTSKTDPLQKACDEFLKFYSANEEICLQLAKSFLEISHFWIIPGGILEIDRTYVLKHPFISCVFVILAMCFDENYKYIEEQKQLYELTMKLLGIACVTDPLTDHDIEAILYLSLYNIARKPNQIQTDSWLISGIAIKQLMLSFDIRGITTRVKSLRRYEDMDLYHLRIFNSLCSCHLQNSLGTGQPVMITQEYFDAHILTLKFPNATIGDAIKVSEIELYLVTVQLLTSQGGVRGTGDTLIRFELLETWKKNWGHLISKDVAGLLTFAYHFCYISLIGHEAKSLRERDSIMDMASVHESLCFHAFKTLELFLSLAPKLVRGSPAFSLAQIVYACITLCDQLSKMDPEQKATTLNLISKVYWHLNQIGEKMNDATDTVGKIVMSLVERAHLREPKTANQEPYQTMSGICDPSTTPASVDYNVYSRELNDSKLSPVQLPDRLMMSYMTTGNSPANISTPDQSSPFHFNGNDVPDLSQFESFEQFFNGVFPELKD